jgi:hypothetical protein
MHIEIPYMFKRTSMFTCLHVLSTYFSTNPTSHLLVSKNIDEKTFITSKKNVFQSSFEHGFLLVVGEELAIIRGSAATNNGESCNSKGQGNAQN